MLLKRTTFVKGIGPCKSSQNVYCSQSIKRVSVHFYQVNASPSLSSTTSADRVMKFSLINDIINIVMPNGDLPE